MKKTAIIATLVTLVGWTAFAAHGTAHDNPAPEAVAAACLRQLDTIGSSGEDGLRRIVRVKRPIVVRLAALGRLEQALRVKENALHQADALTARTLARLDRTAEECLALLARLGADASVGGEIQAKKDERGERVRSSSEFVVDSFFDIP
jgi:hypothetical protein